MTYQASDNSIWLSTEGAEVRLRMYQQANLVDSFTHGASSTSTDALELASPRSVPFGETFRRGPQCPDANQIAKFVNLMKRRRNDRPMWTAGFPMRRMQLSTQEVYGHRKLFVDVGGGEGGRCIDLRTRFPQLVGEVILQDQAIVLALADTAELQRLGITIVNHNLLVPQPITGAKAYYIRHVLHEWPDDECVSILQHLGNAMASDSVLLVDEMILPDKGAVLTAEQSWISTVMASLTKMERNETQWRNIVRRAGLVLERVSRYDQDLGEGLLVITRTVSPSIYHQ